MWLILLAFALIGVYGVLNYYYPNIPQDRIKRELSDEQKKAYEKFNGV